MYKIWPPNQTSQNKQLGTSSPGQSADLYSGVFCGMSSGRFLLGSPHPEISLKEGFVRHDVLTQGPGRKTIIIMEVSETASAKKATAIVSASAMWCQY